MEILCGDALEHLRRLESMSVHTCVTSPPYFNLRDYGNPAQIGMENTVEEYIDRLVEVFREVRRVLRDDGTLWVNIGDSYATSSGPNPPTNTRNSCGHTKKSVPPGYKAKDLIGIPWLLAFALRSDGWYLRQDIIWHKTNCMPESVKDRCTKCHEYIFLLSKNKTYYFDAEAISEPVTESTIKRYSQDIHGQTGSYKQPGRAGRPMKAAAPRFGGNKYGDDGRPENRTKSGNPFNYKPHKNKRDVWTTATGGYRGAHFAVFPEKLIEPCILAGSPAGGIVLDPFAGSGTTGVVCKKTDRDFIGIELNPEYAKMAADRIAQVTEPAEVEQLTIEEATL